MKPKEQASIVIIRLAMLVDGRYRITRPAVLPNMPYDISPKYNPANKGIPAHSEASNGICQSLSVCFNANNESTRERMAVAFSFTIVYFQLCLIVLQCFYFLKPKLIKKKIWFKKSVTSITTLTANR